MVLKRENNNNAEMMKMILMHWAEGNLKGGRDEQKEWINGGTMNEQI